jgi:hypothetical protein
MRSFLLTASTFLAFGWVQAWAGSEALDDYQALTTLHGDWVLSSPDVQEGGATKRGPAAKLLGTDTTAMTFKIVGKGSAVQENLLPDTPKEMVTMYHCDDFRNCSRIQAKHYCAKQNQPELLLDASSSTANLIVMSCDMDTPLCNSTESHVHMIKHELSEDHEHLKTTYTIFTGGNYEKDTIYHFDRKR